YQVCGTTLIENKTDVQLDDCLAHLDGIELSKTRILSRCTNKSKNLLLYASSGQSMQANTQEIGSNRNESTSSESCASRKESVVAVDRFGRDCFTRLVFVLRNEETETQILLSTCRHVGGFYR